MAAHTRLQGAPQNEKSSGQRRKHKAKTDDHDARAISRSEKAEMEAEGSTLPAEDSGNERERGDDDDVMSRTRLDLSGNPLPPIDQLVEALSNFPHIQRLDISDMKPATDSKDGNALTSISWIGEAAERASKRARKQRKSDKDDTGQIVAFGDRLTWLKLSGNASLGKSAKADAWDGLQQLHKLAVLNAAGCRLQIAPPPPVLMAWSSLCALILGHNDLSELPHFPSMPLLNTIVLSHNQLTNLPVDLPANVPSLKKLSITHNRLCWRDGKSPLPDFSVCSHLREVRMSGNEQLDRLPQSLAGWGRGVGSTRRGTGLETLEAADCGLATWDDIAPLLEDAGASNDNVHPDRVRTRGLNSLLLKGNVIAQDKQYSERLLAAHPSIKVLDNIRLRPKVRKDAGKASSPPTVDLHPATSESLRENSDEDGKKTSLNMGRKERKQTKINGGKPMHASVNEPELVEVEEQKARKKQHKRGTRGGRGSSRKQEPEAENDNHQDERSPRAESSEKSSSKGIKKKERVPEKSLSSGNKVSAHQSKKGKNREKEEVDLARIHARAGPAGPAPGAKADQSKAKSSVKKRKAWDDDDDKTLLPLADPSTKGNGKRAKTAAGSVLAKTAEDVDAPARQGKEMTSVAGIVEVAKPHDDVKAKGSAKRTLRNSKQDKADKAEDAKGSSARSSRRPPLGKTDGWTAPRADLSLGRGGAWD